MAASRDALYAAVALQEGYLSIRGLAGALDGWEDGAGPIGDFLRASGAVNDEGHEAIVRALNGRSTSPNLPRESLWDGLIGSGTPTDGDGTSAAPPESTIEFVAIGGRSHPDPGGPAVAGRFRPLQPLARGGLGEVSLAIDAELGRRVALKAIRPEYRGDPSVRARFVFEAEVTGGLEHPGIVPIYSLGREGPDGPTYAMRLIRGESLAEVIKGHRQGAGTGSSEDPESRRRRLVKRFLDACNAVAHAHSRGVLHRDIKPGNIMLGPFGETLVVDWGLARVMGEPGPEDPASGESLPRIDEAHATRPGSAVGTPAYMSPEQASGNLAELGPRSDVYSLGATLYQILTGRSPIAPSPLPEMLEAARSGRFPPPRSVDPSIPRALEAICLKAMANRPDNRYESASDLAADLDRWLADEPVFAWREPFSTRARRWAKRHRPIVAGAASLLLSGLAALAIGLVLIDRERRQTAEQRDLAVEYYGFARDAANDLLIGLADRPEFRRADGLQPVRLAMLRQGREYLARIVGKGSRQAELARDIARAQELLGRITEEIGTKEEAIREYERADEIYGQIHDPGGEILRRRIPIWRRIGGLLRDTGHPAEARALLERARSALGERLAVEDDADLRYELAATFVDLAMLHRGAGDSSALLDALKEAKSHLDAPAPSDGDRSRHDFERADLYDTIGNTLIDLGRLDAAEGALGLARELRSSLFDLDPTNAEIAAAYAETLHDLGDLELKRNQAKKALEWFDQARVLRRRNADRNPEVLRYRAELARTDNDIGMAYHGLNDIASASAAYERAFALAADLEKINPTDVQSRIERIRGENNLAVIAIGRKQLDKAADRLESLLRHQLEAGNSGDFRLRGYLAMTRINLGGIYRKQARPKDAVRIFREGIADQEAVYKAAPLVDQNRLFLDNLLAQQSNVLRELMDFDGALAAIARRLEIGPYKPAYLIGIARLLARMSAEAPGANDGPDRFTRAATEALRRAIAEATDRLPLADDPALRPLEKDPEFRRLRDGDPGSGPRP